MCNLEKEGNSDTHYKAGEPCLSANEISLSQKKLLPVATSSRNDKRNKCLDEEEKSSEVFQKSLMEVSCRFQRAWVTWAGKEVINAGHK